MVELVEGKINCEFSKVITKDRGIGDNVYVCL